MKIVGACGFVSLEGFDSGRYFGGWALDVIQWMYPPVPDGRLRYWIWLALVNTLAKELFSTSAISTFDVIWSPFSEVSGPIMAPIGLILRYPNNFLLLRLQAADTQRSLLYYARLINLFHCVKDSIWRSSNRFDLELGHISAGPGNETKKGFHECVVVLIGLYFEREMLNLLRVLCLKSMAGVTQKDESRNGSFWMPTVVLRKAGS